MTTSELAAELAKQGCLSEDEAVAHLNELSRHIQRLVRQGRAVELPGLGRFEPGPRLRFRFDNKTIGSSGGARQAAGKRRD